MCVLIYCGVADFNPSSDVIVLDTDVRPDSNYNVI
jgi:hypothetical protein